MTWLPEGLQRLDAQDRERWRLGWKNQLTPACGEPLLGSRNRRNNIPGAKWWWWWLYQRLSKSTLRILNVKVIHASCQRCVFAVWLETRLAWRWRIELEFARAEVRFPAVHWKFRKCMQIFVLKECLVMSDFCWSCLKMEQIWLPGINARIEKYWVEIDFLPGKFG